jgi:uncharacterized membrane protein YkvA (DUF1232 family)
MPKRRATDTNDPAQDKPSSRSTAKTTRTRRTSARTDETASRPARRPAAKRTSARKTEPTKPAASPKGNGTGPSRVRRTGTATRTENGQGKSGPPPGKTARDYADAKRALSALWEDITKQTYSTFDTITRRVEKSYEDARKNVTQGDVRYALDKTQSKLKSMAGSSSQLVIRISRQARLLYEMLKDAMAGKFKVPWVTVAAITAALLYLVSPLDIIPDFIPGIGWIDDALVLSLAISVARVDLRRYIKERDLDPAEYGL